MQHAKRIVIFIVLQGLLDLVYISLYPDVSPIRATLIGASALAVLFIPPMRRLTDNYLFTGFISIYSSALFGALLVQAGALISKSPLSAVVHIAILIATYVIVLAVHKARRVIPNVAEEL